ncbi:MAG: phospholipid carrier-dependent glycosyltransferase [Chloroflexi bacterium]|nr:phospholipid carrier-dependent glycosyltransferase [Chloroflexota bacterium]
MEQGNRGAEVLSHRCERSVAGSAKEQEQGSRGARAIGILLLAACFLYSFFNFFINLEAESFYYDEVVYSLSGLEYLQGDFTRNWEHPFLGKYLMGLSLHLFGKSDFSARLPSALFGFLTGIVIYVFAREVTNRWCGLVAVCLWSTSPIVLWVSRRAILDAPFVFFFTLSWYLFWRFFKTKSTGHALLGGVTLGLAVATKVVGVILVPILFLYLAFPGIRDRGFLRPAVLGKLILALTIAGLLFLLIYAPVLDRLGPVFRVMNEHWKWEQRVGHREVVDGVIYDKQPWWTYLYWYWRGYPPYLLNSTPGVLILLGLAVGFALLRGDDVDVFLLLSFLLPFCYLSFYLSFKMFRYAAILEPPLAMLAASFVAALGSFLASRTPPPRRGRQGGGEFCDLESAPLGETRFDSSREGPPSPSPSLRGRGNDLLAERLRYAHWLAILALAAVLILAMIHSTWNIQAEEENRYKAAAHHLSPKIREKETIFVWGYTNVMSWYMGEETEIVGGFNSSGFSGNYLEADYIVVDPLMVSKWPDDPLKTYLEDNQAIYTEDNVGGFKLYTRRSAESCIRRFVDELTNVEFTDLRVYQCTDLPTREQ